MGLLPSTQSIVERLERLSHRPVHITEDESIEMLADMKIARGDQPLHLLRYKQTGSDAPDYLIAYQCGLALRVFELPPEKRMDIGPSEVGRLPPHEPHLRPGPDVRAADLRPEQGGLRVFRAAV